MRPMDTSPKTFRDAPAADAAERPALPDRLAWPAAVLATLGLTTILWSGIAFTASVLFG
jgi:hypothetical protein